MVGEIRNGRAGGEARALSTPCSWANTSISDRSSSVDYRSFLTTETPIPPPAEKFENRPLGPTKLLESATYKMRKSIERLVQGQEVNGPGAFAGSILSPLKSTRYAAFSTTTSSLFLRTIRTTSLVLPGSSKSSPTFSDHLSVARLI